MPKNIVFCADGTWDKPQSPVSVTCSDTNVCKLYNLLTKTADQMPFYDSGVGADGLPLQHLLGGALGAGLYQKIKDGYTAIAQVYDQDDKIFIFGFSRGAYTARALAGMIAVCGLPTQNFSQQLVEAAFSAYRQTDPAKRKAAVAALALYDAQITMVGVWDTVGALGIPAIIGGVDPVAYGFLDTNLHPDVHNAFHGMAIDERRVEFKPTLWTGPFATEQNVDQVWFTGVHCDVGGSYPQTGLSDITLSWMLNKAVPLGLDVIQPEASQYTFPLDPKHALDTIHDSWSLLWGFPVHRAIAANATIANSVEIRIAAKIGYQPPNVLLNPTGLPAEGYGSEQVIAVPAVAAAAVG